MPDLYSFLTHAGQLPAILALALVLFYFVFAVLAVTLFEPGRAYYLSLLTIPTRRAREQSQAFGSTRLGAWVKFSSSSDPGRALLRAERFGRRSGIIGNAQTTPPRGLSISVVTKKQIETMRGMGPFGG